MANDKQTYFITAPYLDAFVHSAAVSLKCTKDLSVPADISEFTMTMLSFAEEWGDKALGHQLRRGITVEGLTNMRTDENHLVLAIGRFGERKFAVLSKGEHETEFIEHDWNDNWNVTGHS